MFCSLKGLTRVSTTCLCLLGFGSQALAATYDISTATGIFAPSYRGSANTTFFGWETFDDPGFADIAEDWVINDITPDYPGTTYAGSAARILGHNLPWDAEPSLSGVDHISGTGNIYTGESPLNETITAPTSGSVGSGFTTIIVQGVTAFGPLGGKVDLADIGGISAEVVQANNALGSGQFWAKYEIPGNAATYDFTLTSSALGLDDGTHMSLTRIVVDTLWSASGYASDIGAVPEPASSAMLIAGAVGTMASMRRYRRRNREESRS